MKTTSTSLLDFGESTVASSDLKSKAVSKLLNDKKEKPNFEKINVSDLSLKLDDFLGKIQVANSIRDENGMIIPIPINSSEPNATVEMDVGLGVFNVDGKVEKPIDEVGGLEDHSHLGVIVDDRAGIEIHSMGITNTDTELQKLRLAAGEIEGGILLDDESEDNS